APNLTPVPHQQLHIEQLRTLLYAADSQTVSGAPTSIAGARQRRQRIAAAMIQRLEAGVARPLERATCATLARALDALVNSRELVPVDVVLLVARSGLSLAQIQIVIEASANPDTEALLSAYLTAFRPEGTPSSGGTASSIPPTRRASGVISANPR